MSTKKKCSTCPAIRMIRRIAHRPQEPRSRSPASPASPPTLMNPSVKTNDIQTKPVLPPQPKSEPLRTPNKKEATNTVAVNFDYNIPPSKKPETKLADPAKTAGKQGHGLGYMENTHPQSAQKPLKTDLPAEGNHRSKAKITGEGNKHEGNNTGMHIEDRFTDYINRAKVKIRTTTFVGEAAKVDKSFSKYINHAKVRIRAMSSIGGGKHDSSN